MPRFPVGLITCVSSAFARVPSCVNDWCQVDASITGSSLEIPKEHVAELNVDKTKCLNGCELEPLCLYTTFEDSTCGWIGRVGIEGTKEITVNNAYWFVQTQNPTRVPNRIKDGSLTKVPLGDGPLSEEQCKGALVEALQDGIVTINYGEWDGTGGGGEKSNFVLADAKNGKGEIEVIVMYNMADNVAHTNHSLGLGDHPGCTSGASSYVVSHEGDVVKLTPAPDDLSNAPKWLFSGKNLAPDNYLSDKECTNETTGKKVKCKMCISKSDVVPSIKENQKGHLVAMVGTASPCTATSSRPVSSYWYFNFQGSDYQGLPFAMGPCGANSVVPMNYLGKTGKHGKPKTCVDGAPADDTEVQCGKYSMDKPPTKTRSLWLRRPDDDNHNCFGFTSTTTTAPPTTSHAPSPAPTTCDFCKSSGLECCGEGIHAFCYSPEYNQCCEAIAEPFDVKVVCALGQQCHPGCLPHGWGDEIQETEDATDAMVESNTNQALSSTAAEEAEELPICHGIGLAFAVCPAGTKCCGRGTSIDPACYYEEWNECCQPPGSDISIICAKGQGCAETNGVPFCVDSFEACRACAGQFEPGLGTYLCHEYGSGTCYTAADPKSCKQVFGESATFCFGVFDYPTETSELEFI